MPKAPTPQDSTTLKFPFLLKAVITAIVHNKAGIEEKKQITAVFQLDEKSAEMPWYALRNFLVPAHLKKTLGPEGSAWKKIYEIKIDKMVNRDNPEEVDGIPLRVMTFEQLEAYVKKWEYPVKPRDFHSVEYARQMIDLFEQDPAGYKVQYEQYVSGQNRKYPELDGLRKNVDAAVSGDLENEMAALEAKTPAPVAVTPVTAPVNPADLSETEKKALGGVGTQPAPAVQPTPKPVSRGTSAGKPSAQKTSAQQPAPVAPAPQAPAPDPVPQDPAPATDPVDPFATQTPADPTENDDPLSGV